MRSSREPSGRSAFSPSHPARCVPTTSPTSSGSRSPTGKQPSRKGERMTISRKMTALAAALAVALGSATYAAATLKRADAPQPIRIGIVSFLTGAAAAPFGIPAQDAAKLLIDRLNKGKVPAPYNIRGFGGHRLQAVYVDEAGGASQAVSNYRQLVQSQNVDLVIGYISSGDCLALAPVVEELKKFTIFFDCGTSSLFQKPLAYGFRTAGDQANDAIAAARYVLTVKGKSNVQSIAGINQNYAWGQDNWKTFSEAMKVLNPDVDVKSSLFPTLFSGQYSTEISRILSDQATVTYSSFWGGDLDSLLQQGIPRGLGQATQLILSTADTALPEFGSRFPAGIIVGARGPHGALAPEDNALNQWFVGEYQKAYGKVPVYPAYHMAQAILGAKASYELAMKKFKTASPTEKQWRAKLRGLTFDTPSGKISMTRALGHQAIEGSAYGISDGYDAKLGRVKLTKVIRYSPKCLTAPPGFFLYDWIARGFPGATCP
ncbi:MAG: ABC transporter substrate-binding protein [Thermoleophilia bacterium]